jgi:hypothetical protein
MCLTPKPNVMTIRGLWARVKIRERAVQLRPALPLEPPARYPGIVFYAEWLSSAPGGGSHTSTLPCGGFGETWLKSAA